MCETEQGRSIIHMQGGSQAAASPFFVSFDTIGIKNVKSFILTFVAGPMLPPDVAGLYPIGLSRRDTRSHDRHDHSLQASHPCPVMRDQRGRCPSPITINLVHLNKASYVRNTKHKRPFNKTTGLNPIPRHQGAGQTQL